MRRLVLPCCCRANRSHEREWFQGSGLGSGGRTLGLRRSRGPSDETVPRSLSPITGGQMPRQGPIDQGGTKASGKTDRHQPDSSAHGAIPREQWILFAATGVPCGEKHHRSEMDKIGEIREAPESELVGPAGRPVQIRPDNAGESLHRVSRFSTPCPELARVVREMQGDPLRQERGHHAKIFRF